MTMLVRLKPYNPRRGYKMRSYVGAGVHIREAVGWHEVPDDVAHKLSEVHADPQNPDTPYAFDVMTRDDAIAQEADEKRKAQERASANEPIKVRRVTPVDDRTDAASRTHYGRPMTDNHGRTHHARPDESDESRDVGALTTSDLPGAPSRRRTEEVGPEYDLAVADMSTQTVTRTGVQAAEQAPFLDGSELSADVPDVDVRNPDPRNLGHRSRGAYDDTPFVDGSRDAVVLPGADKRNPDPRNLGERGRGAYDDTPFVDGSIDAVRPPFIPAKTEEDQAQMTPPDAHTLPRTAVPGNPPHRVSRPAPKPLSRTRRDTTT